VIEDRNPLYSYVMLAKSGSEDGFLEAREMLNLDLKAQLVVLSACETARGKTGGGEGLIGMTWALFLAGSPATVASGWQVESPATAQLMLEMHRGLRQGIGKAAALRSAALALKSDRRYGHPFYWAAFSLSGNGF
jgi:CHAT domain-containing protein